MEAPRSSHPRQQQLLFQSARTPSHHTAPPACCTAPILGLSGAHGLVIQISRWDKNSDHSFQR